LPLSCPQPPSTPGWSIGNRRQIAAAAALTKCVGSEGRETLKLPIPGRRPPPLHDPPPAAMALRGSPIAKRLTKHALQTWIAFTCPQRVVRVSPPPLCLLALYSHTAHATHRGMSPHSFLPHQGKAVSHRRLSLPRTGSLSYWAPRLGSPQSEREFQTNDTSSPPGRPSVLKAERDFNLSHHAPPYGSRNPKNSIRSPGFSLPSPSTLVQEGETTLGIAHLSTCQGKSYSGPIRLTPEIMVHAI